jgi:hypothetical protein
VPLTIIQMMCLEESVEFAVLADQSARNNARVLPHPVQRSSSRETIQMAADLKKAEVDALFQEVERLEAAVDVAVENEKTTKEKMETAIISCKVAEEKLKEAAEAASKTSASMSGATEERKKLQGQTAEARTEVAAAREGVRRYGGSGAGTGEEEPPTFDKPAEIVKDDAALAAVSSVSERELGEVRKLARPPQLVRRALELVQVLLKAAEGKNVKVSAPGEEADWAELQTMLSRPDFIKRVLALNALDLSKRTDLLDRVSERWPALKEAVGTTAAPRWKKTDVMNKLGLRNQLVAAAAKGGGGAAAAAAEAGTEGDEEGAMPPTPGGRGGIGLIAAVKAAAAENKADGPALTVEAVEYASRPCGCCPLHASAHHGAHAFSPQVRFAPMRRDLPLVRGGARRCHVDGTEPRGGAGRSRRSVDEAQWVERRARGSRGVCSGARCGGRAARSSKQGRAAEPRPVPGHAHEHGHGPFGGDHGSRGGEAEGQGSLRAREARGRRLRSVTRGARAQAKGARVEGG